MANSKFKLDDEWLFWAFNKTVWIPREWASNIGATEYACRYVFHIPCKSSKVNTRNKCNVCKKEMPEKILKTVKGLLALSLLR